MSLVRVTEAVTARNDGHFMCPLVCGRGNQSQSHANIIHFISIWKLTINYTLKEQICFSSWRQYSVYSVSFCSISNCPLDVYIKPKLSNLLINHLSHYTPLCKGENGVVTSKCSTIAPKQYYIAQSRSASNSFNNVAWLHRWSNFYPILERPSNRLLYRLGDC